MYLAMTEIPLPPVLSVKQHDKDLSDEHGLYQVNENVYHRVNRTDTHRFALDELEETMAGFWWS